MHVRGLQFTLNSISKHSRNGLPSQGLEEGILRVGDFHFTHNGIAKHFRKCLRFRGVGLGIYTLIWLAHWISKPQREFFNILADARS